MTALASAWAAWIVPASVQVAILGLIAYALDVAVARRVWPELRTALWAAVMLRIVVPPHVAAFEVIPDAGAHEAARIASGAGTASTGLFAVWAMGIGCCGVVFLRRARALTRFLREETRPLADRAILAVADEVARIAGLRRSPELRVAAGAVIPAVAGIRRPCIVVPRALLDPACRSDFRNVLLHECLHVQRRDAVAALVIHALRTLLWFHPIPRLAATRLAGLREGACDRDAVARLGLGARAYARTLASLAQPALRLAPAGSTALFARRAEIVERLELLAWPPRARLARRRAAAAVLLVAVLACGPAIEAVSPPPPTQAEAAPGRRGCLHLRFEVMRALADERVAGH